MTNYTEEVEAVIRGLGSPYPNFVMDVIEYPGGTLSLRVYRPNVDTFNQAEKVVIATHLYNVRDTVRDFGYHCEIEGVENPPPHSAVVREAKDRVKAGRERDNDAL